MAHGGRDSKQVSEQLARILASRCFEKSVQLRQLLTFLVEETLAGRGNTLRQQRLGDEALHRGPDFDTAADNIVRVQVGNLRKKLGEYYAHEGAGDELVIEIPKGSYVPVFRPRSAAGEPPQVRPEQTKQRRALQWTWLLTATITAAIVFGAIFRARPTVDRTPRYTVVERTRLTYEPGFTGHPAPSPDGKAFAFISDRDDEGDLDVWMQTLGGPAIQLADLPGNEMHPDWSPTGKQIAFHSLGDARGIYTVTLDTRRVQRLTDFGYRPRFSPDGQWIAFSGQKGSGRHTIFLVSTAGGTAIRLPLDKYAAGFPVWHPGGHHFVFRAFLEDGTAFLRLAKVATGDKPHLEDTTALGLNGDGGTITPVPDAPSDWVEDAIIFNRGGYGEGDLWAVPIALSEKKLRGPVYLAMTGPVTDYARRVPNTSPPRIIYPTERHKTHIYAFPLKTPTEVGTSRALTRDASLMAGLYGIEASVSHNGRWLAYCSLRQGSKDIVVLDTTSGRETAIIESPADETAPAISASGKQVAYSRRDDRGQAVYVADIETRLDRRLCSECGLPKDWSADGRLILLIKDGGLFSVTVDDGVVRELLREAGTTVTEASLDPKGQWVAMSVLKQSQEPITAYLARLTGGSLAPEADWIFAGSEAYHFQVDWSVDGSWIYYAKVVHDYRCLWGQRVDSASRQLVGEPAVIRHFHRFEPSAKNGARVLPARGLIALNLTETPSDIWMATLQLK